MVLIWKERGMRNPIKVLQEDLVIGFGFSKENAMEAVIMHIEGRLDDDERKALDYLVDKNPFDAAMGKDLPAKVPHSMIESLEHLNYRITMENGR
jgi:hypothetical protein